MEEHNNGFKRTMKWDTEVLGKRIVLDATFRLLDKYSAQDMLSRQYGNQRTLNKAHTDRLAEAMHAGEYIDAVINPIFISDTGNLLDGQHRLTALSQTNQTIPFLVVTGLPDDIFVYIDQNKTRAAKDVVKIAGVSNPAKVAAAVKLIHQCMEGRARTPRNELLYRMIQDYPDIEFAIAKGESMHDSTYIPTSVGGTLYFLYKRWWPEECKQFFDILQYGDQDILSQSQHPITRLKNKLRHLYNKVGKRFGDLYALPGSHGGKVIYDHRWQVMMFIHQAFKSYRTGKRLIWREDQSTIDEIGELCKKTVTLRHSYEKIG